LEPAPQQATRQAEKPALNLALAPALKRAQEHEKN